MWKHKLVYGNIVEINRTKKNITNSELFKFKSRIANDTGNTGTLGAEKVVPSKYLEYR